jgi:Apea-like HEPN
MGKAATDRQRDPELRRLGQKFLETYHAAAAASDADVRRIFNSDHFSLFQGGAVELTEDVARSLSAFVERAAKLLGAKAGNEKAIQELAQEEGQNFIINGPTLAGAVTDLIKRVFDEGNATFDFLIPNYLVRFQEGVRSVTIGRVRAAITADFSAEIAQKVPNGRLQVVPGTGFSIQITAGNVIVEMDPMCWIVTVNAAANNVEEEAKWLIDVASSFLRLQYKEEGPRFPTYGDVEPRPSRQPAAHRVGIKLRDSNAVLPGSSVPWAYEVGKTIEAVTLDSAFCAKAALIFDPPEKSVAERVSRGLGWLTRGRQAEDRAERLLYFFTAIEALLSDDDERAPVVQTIARHASVILSDDIASRVGLSAEIRKLYSLRSALVHKGSRSVLGSSANLTQYIAEALFALVLEKGNLRSQHAGFNDELSRASYGFPWLALTPSALANPSATAPSIAKPSIARSALARSRARFQ